METEWQKAHWVMRIRNRFIGSLSDIEWSDGGWRGNGDDASPSAFRNASSGASSAHPDDPLVKWAGELWEKVSGVVDLEFIAKRGPTNTLAQFLEVPNAWPLQNTLLAISGRFIPEYPEEMAIYKRLAPPTPFTDEQRKEAMLRWRAATGYKGVLTTHENPYFFSEEVLIAELSRLALSFPAGGRQ